MANIPRGREYRPDIGSAHVKPRHILLACLLVVAAMFAGSIVLSMFYVEQNKVDTIDR